MMKKRLSVLLSVVLVLAMLSGCGGGNAGSGAGAGGDSEAVSGGGNLKFSTGGDQGTYYGFGSVLSGVVSSKTDTTVTAITSGGSQANIQALSDGDAELGFVQSDVMAYAYSGTNLFHEAVTDFSTVAALYLEQVQIITLNPAIQSVADLRGKTVSVGDAGSGTYFNAVDVLGAYGLDVEADINPVYESFGTSAESLQDGKIDAAFIVAGAPTTAVTSLAATRQVYLVSLDEEHIYSLLQSSPYYAKSVIPADVYGLAEDAVTVAVGAVVIARDDVSEGDVYNFVSGIFENIGEISHAKSDELDMEYAASIVSVPYHPGAARYFTEKGLKVPAVK